MGGQKPLISRRKIDGDGSPGDPCLHPVIDRIYLSRKARLPDELDYSLHNLLAPDQLLGMETAIDLLVAALQQQKRILIVGDYDADGATSCVVAARALGLIGAKDVRYLVPNRFDYGYGLTPEIVALAQQQKPDLIITVDNGIASIDGVEAAGKNNIKTIITDHHLPGETLPDADAIVNPNQPGDDFPSKNLAGVGVIFYVMLALRKRLRDTGWFTGQRMTEPNLAQLLDLVALGTVADLVSLDYNNRILVSQGLARINNDQACPGIYALLQVANRQQRPVTTSDLSFFVAPRLNAAGRLDDMSLGISCLLADDAAKARKLAIDLDKLNHERRNIQQQMQQQAQLILKQCVIEDDTPKGICLYDENWHQGIVGLVASKIKEKLHRPVIVFAPGDNDEIKGSARSIPGLHIRDALDRVATRHPDLLQKFGGHAMAAGLVIKLENYSAFKHAFELVVNEILDDDDLQLRIWSDGDLGGEELRLEFAQLLKTSGPWGQGFPEPVFDGCFAVKDMRIVGETHIKLRLQTMQGKNAIDAIAFHAAPNGVLPDWQRIHVAYRLDVNEYRGTRTLQLIIEYAEPEGVESLAV